MEKIICSAIWYKELATPVHRPANIDIGVVVCGHRHPHIIGSVNILAGRVQSLMGEYVQGFLTDKNRFVDRREAMSIAFKAKQLIRVVTSPDLFSEDIY